MKDMLDELYQALKDDADLSNICIKSMERPETLSEKDTSIVLIPIGPPMQIARGSNTSLAKSFIYQVNVESIDRMECKRLQRKIEQIFESKGFYQVDGGLDEYIGEIRRYVDARTYKGRSTLYENY